MPVQAATRANEKMVDSIAAACRTAEVSVIIFSDRQRISSAFCAERTRHN